MVSQLKLNQQTFLGICFVLHSVPARWAEDKFQTVWFGFQTSWYDSHLPAVSICKIGVEMLYFTRLSFEDNLQNGPMNTTHITENLV